VAGAAGASTRDAACPVVVDGWLRLHGAGTLNAVMTINSSEAYLFGRIEL
jgi:hypothetical protein